MEHRGTHQESFVAGYTASDNQGILRAGLEMMWAATMQK